VGVSLWAPGGAADEVGDFYRNKTVTVIVGAGAGGGFDLYSRTLSQHLARHLPGGPGFVLKFMPGAGSIKATNYVYQVAPRDGSVMMLPSQSVALFQRLQEGVRYDAARMNWIGRMVSATGVLVVWHTAPATTLEDMKTTEVVFGAHGRGQDTYIFPRLMNALLGYKVKPVLGYPGSANVMNALEKGEVHGYVYIWASLKSRQGDWLRERKLIPIANYSLETPGDRPDLPLVADLAKDPEHKAIFEFFSSIATVGRAFAFPPEVPDARVAAMRQAFMATMKDPAFLADAKKRKMDIEPMSGEKIQAVIEKTVATPQALIDKAKQALK
jgi:tripartite-type tricarboxylate transporter receptor subunit TctC